jgi:hypothetical protein
VLSTPITGRAGPERSTKSRLPDFLTTAQYGGGGRLSALPPGNMSLKKPVTPPGIDPGTVRLVAQRLNHYVTPESWSVSNILHLTCRVSGFV